MKTKTRRWFNIKGASDYLSVSEPTIYRWMKDGTLSFYKVGGSTRFSQEGLDAVIEKTTGLKEAEAAAGRCAACGHHLLIEGRIRSTGQLYFRPDHTKFWTFEESLVPTKAKVCAACGYVQVFVDTSKLTKLVPADEPIEDNA